jgi:predicted HAD superfamily phosphohydrolase YqeG
LKNVPLEMYRPKLVLPTIANLDLRRLREEHGIRKLLVDLDGVLAPNLTFEYLYEGLANLSIARKQGVIEEICIISNVVTPLLILRLWFTAKLIDAKWYAGWWPCAPMKPDQRAFRTSLSLIDANPDETAMVGDQSKDIYGGNRCDLFTILVNTLPPIPIWKRRTRRKDLELFQKLGIEF